MTFVVNGALKVKTGTFMLKEYLYKCSQQSAVQVRTLTVAEQDVQSSF